MTFNPEIPLWGLITLAISILGPTVWAMFKLWTNQQEQKRQIKLISIDQQTMRILIEEKNEKTLAEIKKLELAFALQKESLVEIKTLLNLLINNRIRHEDRR
jgi:hypothetical protein